MNLSTVFAHNKNKLKLLMINLIMISFFNVNDVLAMNDDAEVYRNMLSNRSDRYHPIQQQRVPYVPPTMEERIYRDQLAGGHALRDHVGLTDQQQAARVTSNRPTATGFLNAHDQAMVASDVLNAARNGHAQVHYEQRGNQLTASMRAPINPVPVRQADRSGVRPVHATRGEVRTTEYICPQRVTVGSNSHHLISNRNPINPIIQNGPQIRTIFTSRRR